MSKARSSYIDNNVKQSSLNKGLQKSPVHSVPTVYEPVPLVGSAKRTEKGRESAKPAWIKAGGGQGT